MNTRVEACIERHNKGYNCAQAVACTYSDLFGMDEAEMFRLTEAFGLGMGCMEGTCGAVTGACVLAGLKNSSGDLNSPTTKGATYKLSKAIVTRFIEQNGSSICKELKGVETGRVLRPCQDCIRDAARIAESVLFADR